MTEAGQAKTGSFFTRFPHYFSESHSELKKVHSPTRQEALQATIVTLFIVFFISCVVALMDLVFGWFTRMVM